MSLLLATFHSSIHSLNPIYLDHGPGGLEPIQLISNKAVMLLSGLLKETGAIKENPSPLS